MEKHKMLSPKLDVVFHMIFGEQKHERILYYWSKLYTSQLKRGEDYAKLERCISIVFLDYEIENLKDLPIHTTWKIKNTENDVTILTKDLEIHIIEIAKMKRKLENGELKKWILFLENPRGEEIQKMAEDEKEIKEAIDTLDEISNDEQKIRLAELREKYIWDRNAELAWAEEKGIKKGIEEMARKMIKEGIEVSMIGKLTNLSKEEILKLKEIIA